MSCETQNASHAKVPGVESLKVHPEGHYLMTESGRPFFWLGDTAWELFHRATREEAIRYLDNRAKLGFTVVQSVAIAELDGIGTPNAYGQKPFSFVRGAKEPEPLVPENGKNGYWDHVDFIVKAANERGIIVAMLPTWGRWWKQDAIFTPSSGRRYCEWLARRYREAGVVWVLGGDRPIDTPEERAVIDAMAAGLRAGDGGRHLLTFHPHGGGASSQSLPDCAWIDFHMRQNGHTIHYPQDPGERYAGTLQDALREPAKPILDGEPVYEGHPIDFRADEHGHTIAADVRRAFFWDLFNGAFGHTYGHHSIWQFYSPERQPVNRPLMTWEEALEAPGARQLGLAKRLFEERAFFTRIPAPDILEPSNPKSLVPGAGMRRFAATRDRDGTFAMVYVPIGCPFTVDFSCIRSDRIRLAWYDPRTGEERNRHVIANEGCRTVVPPSVGELLDWVLVADADR